jgi:actin-like ATPase involved in cell morphogenesis
MFEALHRKVHMMVVNWSRPCVVIGIPSGVTGVERRAVMDAATRNTGLEF